jgi:uridine kinase
MRSRRIHIAGASGSGVTSLGRALASTLASSHHDIHATDDYFWLPTTPPCRLQRDVDEADRAIEV